MNIGYCVCKPIIGFMSGHRITDVQFKTLRITEAAGALACDILFIYYSGRYHGVKNKH